MIGGALSRFGAFAADAFGPSADQRPLYPRKRSCAVQLAMSAKGHKRTLRQAQPRSALPPPKAPTAKIESLMFSTHWQCRYLNAAFVRIIGNVKAELNAHGKHHRVFAQHLAPYAL